MTENTPPNVHFLKRPISRVTGNEHSLLIAVISKAGIVAICEWSPTIGPIP